MEQNPPRELIFTQLVKKFHTLYGTGNHCYVQNSSVLDYRKINEFSPHSFTLRL
jgi:hypothetical protein